jgi:NAD(P)H-dependent FMN reductase
VSEPLRIAIIVASTRVGRFADVVVDWFVAQAEQHSTASIEVVDLATFELPHWFPTRATPVIEALSARLEAADAFVIVTPEYNHSFPASLKNAIDWFATEWNTKAIAFVSYGGRAEGARSVEHLRNVFVELHAMTIRDGVTIDLETVDQHGWPESPGIEGAVNAGQEATQETRTLLSTISEFLGSVYDYVTSAEFVGNALSPARVSKVEVVDADARVARVTVPDYQQSLAIGKEGQNARLAARLTGWRIDIRSDADPRGALDPSEQETVG